jgi:hypothetical protein
VYNESHVFSNKGKWFDETRLHPEVPEEGGATAPSVQPLPKNLRATSEEIQRNRAKDLAEEEQRKQTLLKLQKQEQEQRQGNNDTPAIIGAKAAPQ